MKVLIVDDLEENLFVCEQILRRDGLELVTATTARAALEALHTHDFALAIIDVQMPGMDGFELAEAMRADPRTELLPIIFVTASMREPKGLFRGYEAGAVDFLYKPIAPFLLRSKAETFVALHRQRQELEAANRAKDEFLANVTHEIRTPMNAILGLTELVLDTQLTEGQRQSLRTVRSAAGHLLGMIDDVLDHSKIGAGKLELDHAPFALRDAVGETMQALAVRAHRKGLELVCDVDPRAPDALIGDAGRWRQVVINLVGNAIKFTERGEVVFEIGLADGPPQPGRVGLRFAIRDTGIGISRDKQATIFRAFEQEDASTTRRYGGTGLGLTIAAQLIGMMDGEISVVSEVKVGSTFTFTIWLATPDTGASVPSETLRGVRVLLVESNTACRRAIERWLRHWEADATAVDTVAAATDAMASRAYELALVDARLQWHAGARTPTVLLTSGDQPERWAEARLRKPIMPAELFATIRRVLGDVERISEERNAQKPKAVPARAPLRILVAEDNDFNSLLLRQLLGTRGHDVQVAISGREALELVAAHTYDLLLLDIQMPELDGFQVVEAIRAAERGTTRHLPVIAVTARARDRERCLAAGMDEFVVKPVSSQRLWDAIEQLVPDWPR